MKLAILYGGRSGEHEVSLNSAASIVNHLDPKKYELALIYIAHDGAWYLEAPLDTKKPGSGDAALPVLENQAALVSVLPSRGLSCGGKPLPVDAVFPVLHGTFGEDGTIQGLLETAGLPYVGAGVLGSAIGMDKEKSKMLWVNAGLPVVPFIAVRAIEARDPDKLRDIARKAERDFHYPVFVKPSCAGSSVGAGKASNPEELSKAIAEALRWDTKALVEPFMVAREIECSVTGNNEPVAYAPGEILPTHEFYDYDAKYLDPEGASLKVPADLDPQQARTVREIAVKAYRAAELSGMARVDFFIGKKGGEILLNEVNTIPGFTSISMFPKMCEASGLPYPDLLDLLVKLAVERHHERESLTYTYGR
jgi:D-alanine-D-alanine ligase